MSPILQAFIGGVCGVAVVFAGLGFARRALRGRADFRFARILVLLSICLACGALTFMAAGLLLPEWEPEPRIALAAILSWLVPYAAILLAPTLGRRADGTGRKAGPTWIDR